MQIPTIRFISNLTNSGTITYRKILTLPTIELLYLPSTYPHTYPQLNTIDLKLSNIPTIYRYNSNDLSTVLFTVFPNYYRYIRNY